MEMNGDLLTAIIHNIVAFNWVFKDKVILQQWSLSFISI